MNRPHVISLRDQLAGPVGQASGTFAGLTFLLILIACANVAQLLLSRIAERREELAMRAALGASRARLLQQLTTEATVLTVAGAALGLAVAFWTARLASSFAPAQLATQTYTVLAWPVIAFAFTLALLTGIVFGVLPSTLLGTPAMRTGQAVRGPKNQTAKAALVGLQVFFTLTLLTCAIAVGESFLNLLHVDLGFRPADVATLSVSLQGTKYRGGATEWAYYREVLRRLRLADGVEAAGAVAYLPLQNSAYMANAFKLDSGQSVKGVLINAVTADYFRSMATAFGAGRDLSQGQSKPSVIVNEAFARQSGLGGAIVGRNVKSMWRGPDHQIVGVVKTRVFP